MPVTRSDSVTDDSYDFEPLLAAAQTGADWAWKTLYNDLAPHLRAYVRIRGAAEPDDLVGETFVHLARRVDTFTGTGANFRSWAFTVAHHRLIDERRRSGRRPVEPTDPSTMIDLRAPTRDEPEEAGEARAGNERIERLLDTLTDDQRAVVLLRVIGDQSIEDTSVALDKPASAIKALQRRAMASLRRSVEAEQ